MFGLKGKEKSFSSKLKERSKSEKGEGKERKSGQIASSCSPNQSTSYWSCWRQQRGTT